ncbi:MAG: hypothetical protein H6765_07800 [Candidatus Peribacteria bacterium]|nr:MAG: hypothetical protein H6765_07800 [Candidatus Peribacteria bacterium]
MKKLLGIMSVVCGLYGSVYAFALSDAKLDELQIFWQQIETALEQHDMSVDAFIDGVQTYLDAEKVSPMVVASFEELFSLAREYQAASASERMGFYE